MDGCWMMDVYFDDGWILDDGWMLDDGWVDDVCVDVDESMDG